MEDKKQATIVDVAKAAGVSVATVSRVVNGNYPVKTETKEKVRAAISSLNYVPNVQARELNTRKSTTIGVVVPGLYNMFFAEVIDGIERDIDDIFIKYDFFTDFDKELIYSDIENLRNYKSKDDFIIFFENLYWDLEDLLDKYANEI